MTPRWILFALCLVVPAISYRVGGAALWVIHGVGCAIAAAIALWHLYDDGQLRAALSYRSGDPTLAVASSMLLYGAVYCAFVYVIAPDPLLRLCSPRGAWVPRPDVHGFSAVTEWARDRACHGFARSAGVRGHARGVAIVAVAAAEELAWRGGVQQLLAERIGSTRAWLAASALFALAHLGTGNGAVALLALAGGFLWGGLYLLRGRLVPSLLAHCLFSFAFFHSNVLFGLRYDGVAP